MNFLRNPHFVDFIIDFTQCKADESERFALAKAQGVAFADWRMTTDAADFVVDYFNALPKQEQFRTLVRARLDMRQQADALNASVAEFTQVINAARSM